MVLREVCVGWFGKNYHSKQDCELEFRTIEAFNTVLLAKQLWRLIEHLESLFAKIFKGRYFRKTDPLDSDKSYSPSFG